MIENFNQEIVSKVRATKDIMIDAEKIDATRVGNEVLAWVISNVENFIDNQTKIFKLDLVIDNPKEMEETKKLQDLYRSLPDPQLPSGLINGGENSLSYKQIVKDIEKQIEEVEKCRKYLDNITKNAFEHVKSSRNALGHLFQRMIFYYERVIPSPANKKRAMEIDAELKFLIMEKEACKGEEDKAKIQKQITEKIKEGEKLVLFDQFEGSVAITNFEYEAFDVNVRIKEGHKPGYEELEEPRGRKILKEYTVGEGFTVWLEISYKHKQKRPTNLF
jgi:hypothetical protein